MKIDRRDARPLERREEAASSRELQDHCQGKHQGESNTSEARSRTCERQRWCHGCSLPACYRGPIGVKLGVFNRCLKMVPNKDARGRHRVIKPQLCWLPAMGLVPCIPYKPAGLRPSGWPSGHQEWDASLRTVRFTVYE